MKFGAMKDDDTGLHGTKKQICSKFAHLQIVANSTTNFAINLSMKCFRFATTKFTSNLQAPLHNLQIYL